MDLFEIYLILEPESTQEEVNQEMVMLPAGTTRD